MNTLSIITLNLNKIYAYTQLQCLIETSNIKFGKIKNILYTYIKLLKGSDTFSHFLSELLLQLLSSLINNSGGVTGPP